MWKFIMLCKIKRKMIRTIFIHFSFTFISLMRRWSKWRSVSLWNPINLFKAVTVSLTLCFKCVLMRTYILQMLFQAIAFLLNTTFTLLKSCNATPSWSCFNGLHANFETFSIIFSIAKTQILRPFLNYYWLKNALCMSTQPFSFIAHLGHYLGTYAFGMFFKRTNISILRGIWRQTRMAYLYFKLILD